MEKEETFKSSLFKVAFTLIELLVVIAIIGILSGLIIVGMNGMTQKANIAKAQVFSNSLRNALMASLVSEYKFEGPTTIEGAATASDAADSWGNNNASSVSPSITVKGGADCFSNKCLFFNTTGSITFNNPDNFDVKYLTLSLWFKINSFAGGDSWIISKPGLWGSAREGWLFGINNTSKKMVLWGQSTGGAIDTTFSTVYSQGIWYNFVYTYDGDYEKSYINGVLIDPVDAANGIIVPCSEAHEPLQLGSGLNGYIDEVRIFSAPIPTSQIKENYYAGLNKLLLNGGISKKEYTERMEQVAQQ